MNTTEFYTNILEQINLLDEYQKKSLAIMIMQSTLNDYQNDINFILYKESIRRNKE